VAGCGEIYQLMKIGARSVLIFICPPLTALVFATRWDSCDRMDTYGGYDNRFIMACWQSLRGGERLISRVTEYHYEETIFITL